MKLKAILIDDEPLALSLLEHQLEKTNNVEIVKTFQKFDVDKQGAILQEIHVVFLDIEMPGIDGLNLAEQINSYNPTLPIVFVTAFNEYAVQAFELDALDYLMKPVKQERLEKTLLRIEEIVADQELEVLPRTDILYVQLCRELSFSLEGHNQLPVNLRWRTQKTQELFIYLLYHSGETIQKAKLAELFWPEYEQDRAFAQLYTAIYNIRKTLAPYSNHLRIESVYEGYTLYYKNISIDVIKWEKDVRSLPVLNEDTIFDYETAMQLYKGPFLESYNYDWADPEQFRLGLLWIDIATRIADYYKMENAVEQAIIWYERICDYRPEDEHANLSIMKLHAVLGYGILVDHQYSQYKQIVEELELTIDPKIYDWYQAYNNAKQ